MVYYVITLKMFTEDTACKQFCIPLYCPFKALVSYTIKHKKDAFIATIH